MCTGKRTCKHFNCHLLQIKFGVRVRRACCLERNIEESIPAENLPMQCEVRF